MMDFRGKRGLGGWLGVITSNRDAHGLLASQWICRRLNLDCRLSTAGRCRTRRIEWFPMRTEIQGIPGTGFQLRSAQGNPCMSFAPGLTASPLISRLTRDMMLWTRTAILSNKVENPPGLLSPSSFHVSLVVPSLAQLQVRGSMSETEASPSRYAYQQYSLVCDTLLSARWHYM